MAVQNKKKSSAEVTTPQSEGVFDAEGSVNFEPGPGVFTVKAVKPLAITISDDEGTNYSSIYRLGMEIEAGEDEEHGDCEGRYWSHSIFISRDPVKRKYGLNEVKDLFRAFGVEISKNPKTGADIFDPEDFVGKSATCKISPSLDKDTGEVRMSNKGTPFVNRRWSALQE